ERFRREARAAAMLRHPNVVVIHDYGETDAPDAPAYIVMEMVAGHSLRDLLDQEGKLPVARAASLIRPICAGVAAAHRNNIVHRDLKPDNIFIVPPHSEAEQETAKVLDFGIAKLRDAAGGQGLTQTGVVIGTPYYMSPEQCRAEQLDSRSDVYSLGAVLYEMLSGAPPFEAATATGVVAKHLTEPPPRLPSGLGVSSPVEAVIMRALSKEPGQRQADAGEFASELTKAVSGEITKPMRQANTARETPAPPPTRMASVSEMEVAAPGQPAYGGSYHQGATVAPMQAKQSRAGLIAGVVIAVVVLLAGGGAGFYFLAGSNVTPESGTSNQNSSSPMLAQTQQPGAYAPGNNNQPAQSSPPVVAPNPAPQPNQNAVPSQPAAAAPVNPLPAPTPSVPHPGPPAGGASDESIARRAESLILANQRLSESDLEGLPATRLRMLRNTVYARHGRLFNAPVVRVYFMSRDWYSPRPDYKDSDLTPIDRANIRLISIAENRVR
ncbi:MAG TPA: protein kinase, partial [Blastocatellia bacterium]|nr:protein kinase [Blastocatellia bacterium]